MSTQACYRKLNNYKYQLVEDFSFRISIEGFEVNHPFIKLDKQGNLTVKKSYAWDGASGPTIDTRNAMRASLVHDVLYQLLRLELITQDQVKPVDQLFRKMLVEDGMSAFRAWYWYRGLRLANGKAAKPGTQKPPRHICAP